MTASKVLVHIVNRPCRCCSRHTPNQPEAHLPDIEPSEMWDKVGLIQAISVKVHLSILIVTVCHILKLLHCTCPRSVPCPSAKSYSTQSKRKLVVNQNNFSSTCHLLVLNLCHAGSCREPQRCMWCICALTFSVLTSIICDSMLITLYSR